MRVSNAKYAVGRAKSQSSRIIPSIHPPTLFLSSRTISSSQNCHPNLNFNAHPMNTTMHNTMNSTMNSTQQNGDYYQKLKPSLPYEEYHNGNQKLQKIKSEMRKLMDKAIEDLKRIVLKQGKRIIQLQRIIQQNEQQISRCQLIISNNIGKPPQLVKQIQSPMIQYQVKQQPTIQAKQAASNNSSTYQPPSKQHVNIPYLSKKVRDIQQTLTLLASQSTQDRQYLNQKLQTLQNSVIRCYGRRLALLQSILSQYILHCSKRMHKIQDNISKLSSQAHTNQEYVFSIATALTRISKQMSSMSDAIRNSIREEADISEISIKDSSFMTTEEDYFIQSYFPIQNGFTNKNPIQNGSPIVGLLELIQSRSDGRLRAFIDGEGWMRYADSGTYIFNRTGDRIMLSHIQIEWIIANNIIQITNEADPMDL